MSEVVRIASAWVKAEKEGVAGALATVIRTHGSTFRRPGARMLILDDATTVGSVSGGCLENSVIEAGQEVMLTGRSQTLRYDGARDDVILGEGAMCDGEVAIVVEQIDEELSRSLRKIACREEDHDFLITMFDREGVGPHTVIGTAFSEEQKAALFHERVQAPVRVVLCGAGALADAVARLATTLGWDPLVVDHRPHFLASMSVPTHELKDSSELATILDRPARTAVVVMTHHFERDCALVTAALARSPMYVGLLGSRGRSTRVMDEIGGKVAAIDLERIHAPVGLEIGSETIEEIALSIVAEIQAVRRGAAGGSLRESESPVHGRRSARLAAAVLAAGGSSRMGTSKLTMKGPDGRPMIEEIIRKASALELADLLVVTGADEDVPALAQQQGARVVSNEEWPEGLGSSVRKAVSALGDDVDAVLILLGDQPRIERGDLEKLWDRWRTGSAAVVATRYESGGGVPAVFDRSLFGELRRLTGDQGARALLRSLEDVDLVEVSDARDVDDSRSWDDIVASTQPRKP